MEAGKNLPPFCFTFIQKITRKHNCYFRKCYFCRDLGC